MKRRMIRAEEYDLYTKWRHVLFWQQGERHKIKRRTHKRERREAQQQIKEQQ